MVSLGLSEQGSSVFPGVPAIQAQIGIEGS